MLRDITYHLQVDHIHKIWINEYGPENGIPLLILHGGPGAPYADDVKKPIPNGYRAIIFHQRGCGYSLPQGSLVRNSPKHSVKDIEKIRIFLNIDKFVIHGASYGAFLAVAYAEKYPENVCALILCGISLMNDMTVRVSKVMAPDIWHQWSLIKGPYWKGTLAQRQKRNRENLKEYMKHLKRREPEYVKRWVSYQGGLFNIMKFKQGQSYSNNPYYKDWIQALIGCHYGLMIKGTCIDGIDILKNVHKLSDIPGYVIHGRNDIMTAPENSYELVQRWRYYSEKKIELVIPNFTGHRRNDYGIYTNVITAYKRFINECG